MNCHILILNSGLQHGDLSLLLSVLYRTGSFVGFVYKCGEVLCDLAAGSFLLQVNPYNGWTTDGVTMRPIHQQVGSWSLYSHGIPSSNRFDHL